MALSLELPNLDGLDDAVKALYVEKDGKFTLDVSGLPDVAGLKQKNDELLAEKKESKRKADEAETARKEAERAAAEKSGDTEALNKSWQEKLDAAEAKSKVTIDQLTGTVTNLTTGNQATTLASDLAIQGSAEALLPHIQTRLKTEFIEGQPRTVVLDKEGKPSAMTVAELGEEFKANKAFSPLIAASKAGGAGLQQQHGNGSGATDTSNMSPQQKMDAGRGQAAQK